MGEKKKVTLQAAQIQRRKVGSRSEMWSESSRVEAGKAFTTMSSAFEPVSVTPWSASVPHAHGRDAGKQRAPRCPSAPGAAHVFEPITLLTAGVYRRREPRRAIAA